MRRDRNRWLEVPDWSPTSRTRVLIENPDVAVQWAMSWILTKAGYDVACCSGPGPDGACPLVDGGRCTAVDGADVVVNSLVLGDPASQCVLTALRATVDDDRIIVEVTDEHAEKYAGVLGSVRRAGFPITPKRLLASVEAASGSG